MIQGNEDGKGSCGVRTQAGEYYFNISIGECNVKTAETTSKAIHTVNLVSKRSSKASGSLLFQKDFDFPTITCRCELDLKSSAAAAGVTVEFLQSTQTNSIAGTSSFNPSLTVYPSEAFLQPLSENSAFPTSSDRFYLQVTTAVPGDVLGLSDCTVAPSNSWSDPFAAQILTSFCPAGLFDWKTHTAAGTNNVRWSLKKFKFAGADKVFINCTVIRCAAAPCGTCQARRLGARYALDSDNNGTTLRASSRRLEPQPGVDQATLSFLLSPGEADLVLANAVPPAQFASLSSNSGEARDMFLNEGRQQGMAFAMRANFTLYGFSSRNPIAVSQALHTVLADKLMVPKKSLQIQRIMAVWATGSTAKLLAEAISTEFLVMSPGQREAALIANRSMALHQDRPRRALLSTLATELGMPTSDFDALGVELGHVTSIGMLKLAPASKNKPHSADLLPPVIAASAAVFFCSICCLIIYFRYFHTRDVSSAKLGSGETPDSVDEPPAASATGLDMSTIAVTVPIHGEEYSPSSTIFDAV